MRPFWALKSIRDAVCPVSGSQRASYPSSLRFGLFIVKFKGFSSLNPTHTHENTCLPLKNYVNNIGFYLNFMRILGKLKQAFTFANTASLQRRINPTYLFYINHLESLWL